MRECVCVHVHVCLHFGPTNGGIYTQQQTKATDLVKALFSPSQEVKRGGGEERTFP